jgi:CDGSH-type Zn-finger protein
MGDTCSYDVRTALGGIPASSAPRGRLEIETEWATVQLGDIAIETIQVRNGESEDENLCDGVHADLKFSSSEEEIQTRAVIIAPPCVTQRTHAFIGLRELESANVGLIVRYDGKFYPLTGDIWPFDPTKACPLRFGEWNIEVNVRGARDVDSDTARFVVWLNPDGTFRLSRGVGFIHFG